MIDEQSLNSLRLGSLSRIHSCPQTGTRSPWEHWPPRSLGLDVIVNIVLSRSLAYFADRVEVHLGDLAIASFGTPPVSNDIPDGFPPLNNETIIECTSYGDTLSPCSRARQRPSRPATLLFILIETRIPGRHNQSSSRVPFIHHSHIFEPGLRNPRPRVRERNRTIDLRWPARRLHQQAGHDIDYTDRSWLGRRCRYSRK